MKKLCWCLSLLIITVGCARIENPLEDDQIKIDTSTATDTGDDTETDTGTETETETATETETIDTETETSDPRPPTCRTRKCLYDDDFELGVGDFKATNSISSWEHGIPSLVGPLWAHSGDNVWGTALDTDHIHNENSFLEMESTLDLSGYSGESFVVSWWEWIEGNQQPCCQTRYKFQAEGGTMIMSSENTIRHASALKQGEWVQKSYVMSSDYAQPDFRMSFYFDYHYNASTTSPGWYIDDICISSLPSPIYSSDFEADDGGFFVSVSSANSSWAHGEATNSGAHGSTKVWATNLTGMYNTNENSELIHDSIDISGHHGKEIIIAWWLQAYMDELGESIQVDYAFDDQNEWTSLLPPSNEYDVYRYWHKLSYNIGINENHDTLKLQFTFKSDPISYNDGATDIGVFIDEVEVFALDPWCDPNT